MDWEEGSKEAVAGSVLSSSPESRGVLPTPSSSVKSGSPSISSTSKTSFSTVVTSPIALKSAVVTVTSALSTPLVPVSTSSSSGYNNTNKEVAGRLGSPSSSPSSVKEGGHLLLKHNHHQKQEDSSTSPISLVVFEEDDKEQKQPTDLSNPKKNRTSHHQQHQQQQVLSLTTRKNKPIPPPLDLSIGANTNLSLHQYHHNHNNPNHHQTHSNQNQNQPQVGTFNPPHQQPHHQHINNHHQYHHHPYIGSPKFAQSDKNLPLRKRWHSWSPVPMNGQEEDSMVPLYPDSHQHNMANKTGLAGVGDTAVSAHSQQQQNQYHQPYSSPGPGGSNYGGSRWALDFVPIPTSSSPCTNGLRGGIVTGNNGHAHTHNNNHNANASSNNTNNSNNNNNGNENSLVHIQTPTPFYTPNEPSPKFMNSPVFSYSNPDTSLYQGPFSPIRASSLYPPPSSPFTNLSLNSPLGPLSATGAPHTPGISSTGGMGNSCFNMIPSTLLSPAPSQASTNSLSIEDLHDKSLSFFTPVWSIFMAGTKVRFVSSMNSMDWYLVDFLAQSGESLGFKGEYAPHGLEVRKFIVTSSAKERIQVTFCPIGDPHHPTIEVNCEPGHPFLVDKKGWCAVKPEVFQEDYRTQCQPLECGDVCLSLNAARSPSQYSQSHQQHQHQNHHHQSAQIYPVVTTSTSSIHQNHNGHNGFTPVSISSGSIITKMEPIDEKMVPISVVPQTQHNNNNNNNTMSMPMSAMNSPASRKTFASPISAPASPAKKSKDGSSHPNNVPGETKGRRPMNAFLLFAKDKRPELIQMYPGKDNRTISVLLGEAWATLDATEKEKYASNARARAEEQKRMHPDCWKRKRSQSTSS